MPQESESEFHSYLDQYPNPFDFINGGGREIIVSLLEEERQGSLFDFDDIRETLCEIETLYGERRLYRRWSRDINGKKRDFAVLHPVFERFVKKYVNPFISKIPVHAAAHGSERKWSPRASLETHLPCASVLSFDLSNAFCHVGVREVFDLFYRNLLGIEERSACAGFFAMILTRVHEDARVLPQGSPHSPALFNRVLYGIDVYLDRQAQERGLTYTRWVDDFTISSPHVEKVEDLLGAVAYVAERQPIAQHKIYFQTRERPIYLLGHVIERGRIYKNSAEDRARHKIEPLHYDEWFNSGIEARYSSW